MGDDVNYLDPREDVFRADYEAAMARANRQILEGKPRLRVRAFTRPAADLITDAQVAASRCVPREQMGTYRPDA